MMESLWATPKKELIQQQQFTTRAHARSAIFELIEVSERVNTFETLLFMNLRLSGRFCSWFVQVTAVG
ncbi:MAG: hypothetical protein EXS15_07795 [Phycisphaerales bacterium]|nr:hypothetical protein [Phycisphaerales bacterium]